jgi:hypothetical protein
MIIFHHIFIIAPWLDFGKKIFWHKNTYLGEWTPYVRNSHVISAGSLFLVFSLGLTELSNIKFLFIV